MEFKYLKIDPENATRDQIKEEIARMQNEMNIRKNIEQAIKILINSMYGATANKFFVCFSTDVAEAVTLQGQELLKYSIKIIDNYFMNFWHNDHKIHEQIGIKVNMKLSKSPVVYGDTDSCYISFKEILDTCTWKGSFKDFVIKLNEVRFKDYLNKSFDKLAESCHTENLQDFEMETISESGIWLEKKKYVLDIIWKDPGIDYQPGTKIKPTGVELVQSSTPLFARKKLLELLKYIFSSKSAFSMAEYVRILKDLKQQFKLENIETISSGIKIGDYEKYILNDTTELEIDKGCPMHVRAAAYYNFKINNDPKLKQKYQLIKSGDKIKFYLCKTTSTDNVFGYHPNNHPYEFAPEVDYDSQFSKVIIAPINRFVQAIGFPSIPDNLIVAHSLF